MIDDVPHATDIANGNCAFTAIQLVQTGTQGGQWNTHHIWEGDGLGIRGPL